MNHDTEICENCNVAPEDQEKGHSYRTTERGFAYDVEHLNDLGQLEENGVRLTFDRWDNRLEIERIDSTDESAMEQGALAVAEQALENTHELRGDLNNILRRLSELEAEQDERTGSPGNSNEAADEDRDSVVEAFETAEQALENSHDIRGDLNHILRRLQSLEDAESSQT